MQSPQSTLEIRALIGTYSFIVDLLNSQEVLYVDFYHSLVEELQFVRRRVSFTIHSSKSECLGSHQIFLASWPPFLSWISKLAFTGSTISSKQQNYFWTGYRNNLKPVTLELGGKSPFFVLKLATMVTIFFLLSSQMPKYHILHLDRRFLLL